MDDQALDALLRERLAPLSRIDEGPSQVRRIMDALDEQPLRERSANSRNDWLLLAAWLLAAVVALPLLSQLDLSALAGTLDGTAGAAPVTLLSLGAALLAGLLVYPLLTE